KYPQNRTGHLFQEVRHQRMDGRTMLMADLDTMAGLRRQGRLSSLPPRAKRVVGRVDAEGVGVGGIYKERTKHSDPPPASLWRASALPSSAPSPPLRGGRDRSAAN